MGLLEMSVTSNLEAEEINYEELLAPIAPKDRKKFIMDAVMGLVVTNDELDKLKNDYYVKGYRVGYNFGMKGN